MQIGRTKTRDSIMNRLRRNPFFLKLTLFLGDDVILPHFEN